jgi:nucleotide-binding universal stress UspA family protein
MKTILVGTDGSDSAGEALHFAIDLARETGAELHVVSVRPPTFHGRGGPMLPMTPVAEVHGAAIIADAAADEARTAGVRAQSHEARGDEAEAIRAMADQLDVDLVVVGSHGHGAIGAALVGSVSRALVKHCTRPLTVVRTQPVAVTADV